MPEAIPYLIEIGKAIAIEVARAAVVYAASELLGLNDRAPGVDQIQAPVKQSVPPKQKAYGRGRLSGPFLYWVTKNGLTIEIIALAKGPIEGIESYMLHDDEVTVVGNVVQRGADGRYQRDGGENDTIRIYSRTGETPSAVYPEVVTASAGEWSNDHRADGVATVAVICRGVKAEIVQRIYPNGPVSTSAIGSWSKCYDWRKDSTMGGSGAHRMDNPATWEWTENPIVALLNDEVFERGQDFAYRFFPALASWSTAADICDEPIMQFVGGVRPRYSIFAFYKSNNPPKDLRKRFLVCCDGLMLERGDGAFVVFAGKYYAPTVVLNEDNFRRIRWTRTRRTEDFVNTLVISYQSPAHKWQMQETVPWKDQDSVAALGEWTAPLELPWVTNNSQARRLAKATFARLTAGYVGEFVIAMTDDGTELEERYLRLRWAAGPTTANDVIVEITGASLDLANRLVTMQVMLADPTAYDWTAAEEEAPPGVPVVTPPDPLFGPIVETAGIEYDGTAGRLRIVMEDPERPGWGVLLRWQNVVDMSWVTEYPEPDFDSGGFLIVTSSVLPMGITVQAEVSFVSGSVGPSTPVGPFTVTTIPAGAMTDEAGAYMFDESGAFMVEE